MMTGFSLNPGLSVWRRLAPQDLIVIDFNGKRIDGPADERSAVREWPIHAQIYRARPDVGCVLHVHPSASTLMAALGIEVEPLDQDCASFTDQLPVLDNGAVSISTTHRGDEVARALGKMKAVLLKNHGCAVVGTGVPDVRDSLPAGESCGDDVTNRFASKAAGDAAGRKGKGDGVSKSGGRWRAKRRTVADVAGL